MVLYIYLLIYQCLLNIYTFLCNRYWCYGFVHICEIVDTCCIGFYNYFYSFNTSLLICTYSCQKINVFYIDFDTLSYSLNTCAIDLYIYLRNHQYLLYQFVFKYQPHLRRWYYWFIGVYCVLTPQINFLTILTKHRI